MPIPRLAEGAGGEIMGRKRGEFKLKIKMLIDYLTFSIKPVSSVDFDLDFVMGFLGFDKCDFVPIGPRMHYQQCYNHPNGICVYESFGEKVKEMGICVSMSGSGCRYFESHLKDGEFCADSEIWIGFFRRLRNLNHDGYAVNVSRVDVAVDDRSFDGEYYLDLDLVESASNSREFVSQFRHMENYTSKNIMSGKVTGKCIYYGSMKSAVCCRFYDKLAEQRMKYAKDKEQLKELEGVTHWVRMEFVFKGKQAIKLVNAMCDSANFALFFARLVNGYVRFVEPDNENVSRCTMKTWWRRFIGTVEHTNLSTGDFKPYSFGRICHYYLKYLSTTVFTLMSRLSPSEFFDMTRENAVCRLRKKHRIVIDGGEQEGYMTMADWWMLLNPIPIEERVLGAFA